METSKVIQDRTRAILLNSLTNREKQVIGLVLRGFSNKQIAEELFLSVKTVEFHIRNAFAKFSIKKRIELINILFCDEPIEWRNN